MGIGGRGASSILLGRSPSTSPKASPAMSTPPILAWKHRLELPEARRIVREFSTVRGERDVITESDFRKVLCQIFGATVVDRDLCLSAYRECSAGTGFDIDKFCGWYMRNMFTAVNRLNAAADQIRSDSMVYEASKKFRIPTAQIDKIKRVFDRFDTDGSGEIDFDEFKEMIFVMLKVKDHRMISEDRLKKFWREIDWDGSNCVDFVEFVAWYLKYFGTDEVDSEFSPSIAEAFYDSFNPSIQRRQILDTLARN
jgi:Ca2+-binding EF-hand superfamily protein